MQIGDRVMDRGTKFIGTIVQLDPPTGVATRARFQADDLKRNRVVGDPPPESMWERIDNLELVDRQGRGVSGNPGAQLDASGNRLDSSASAHLTGEVDSRAR